jgi:hypothetical protein
VPVVAQNLRVHVAPVAASLVLALLFAACGRSDPSAGSTAPSSAAARPAGGDPWLDDGRPQTGLPRMKLYLGAHELTAELALTTQAIQKA